MLNYTGIIAIGPSATGANYPPPLAIALADGGLIESAVATLVLNGIDDYAYVYSYTGSLTFGGTPAGTTASNFNYYDAVSNTQPVWGIKMTSFNVVNTRMSISNAQAVT